DSAEPAKITARPYHQEMVGEWLRVCRDTPEPVFQLRCCAIVAVTNCLAPRTARSSERPLARPAVIAAEYVHPVPCVAIPREKGAENSITFPPAKRRSIASRPER